MSNSESSGAASHAPTHVLPMEVSKSVKKLISLEMIYHCLDKDEEFYNENGAPFRVTEKNTKRLCVARGFCEDKYQTVKYVRFVDQAGREYTQYDSLGETTGGSLYNIRFKESEFWNKKMFILTK